MQTLFSKISAALPGMEALSSTHKEDMVDVNLKSIVIAIKIENKA